MTVWGWILAAALALFVFPALLISFVIFCKLLVRAPSRRGKRLPCFPEEDEYMAMWETALAWRERWAENRREVSVRAGRMTLRGEYYDFGGNRAVMVLPGRTECCVYSAFFAEPYRTAGYNVLLIDSRGTGLSDGTLNCLGFREWRDALRWAELLHGPLKNREVFLHGVCIGCSTALRVCVRPETPEWITGMAAEGMFQRFYDTAKQHMIESRRPVFPALQALMIWIRLFCGGSAAFDGPIRDVREMRRPMLMLHSREDTFSLPDRAQALYDLCPSPVRRIVWFRKGRHSRVRLNNTEGYDEAVIAFLEELNRRDDG